MTDPRDGLRVPARYAPFVLAAVVVGFAVAACAVTLAVALLVRHHGGGVLPRSLGALADLAVVATFGVLVRRTARSALPAWTATAAVALVAAATLAYA